MNLSFTKRQILIVVISLFIPSLVLAEADGQPAKVVRKAGAVLTVTTVKPKWQPWPLSLSANGGLYAWQDAVIAAEISGLRITRLYVDIGDEVKRGQKLAQLSQDLVEADLAQKQALVAQAKAELAEAEANAKRAINAKGGNAFSEQQTTQYLIARDKARANLDAAKAQLKAQQIRLRQTNIVAVDDGVIASRSATLGAVVQTGTELFRLVRKNRLEWRAEMMAEQLAQIRPGQKAHINLANGNVINGTVRVSSPTIDPGTRKALVYVDLPVSDSIRPGMFVRGTILLGEKEALTVPESALVMRDGYSYVFELDENQRAIQRKVVTGRRDNRRVEIIDGLNPNAVVVATGGAFLNSGDKVLIAEINEQNAEKNLQ
ncbi:MAG: efflux RND transporter periplasmic adaptor subunit [Gammaproteobacteria bacterium]|jgi:RND family efflux transporter MFP subunit